MNEEVRLDYAAAPEDLASGSQELCITERNDGRIGVNHFLLLPARFCASSGDQARVRMAGNEFSASAPARVHLSRSTAVNEVFPGVSRHARFGSSETAVNKNR